MQVVFVLLLTVGAGWIVASNVDDWADWVVLGAVILTVIGFAIAINHRQYPTKKRSFTRDSDSKW